MKIKKNKKLASGNFVKPHTPKKNGNTYLLRRIIITNIISLMIIVATYFWMIYFLSNVNSFWALFRGKDVQIQQDSVAPLPPFLETISEAVSTENTDINGRAEPGVKVILYVDGTPTAEAIADSQGNYSFLSIPVGPFPINIYTITEDESGNQSGKSNSYSVVQDEEPPKVEITKPEPEEKFRSTGHSYRVEGNTEPGATVLVNNQLAVLTPSGDFSASLRLEEGSNEIKVLVTDKADNKTEKSVFMLFEKVD